jgi:hypothetical protein
VRPEELAHEEQALGAVVSDASTKGLARPTVVDEPSSGMMVAWSGVGMRRAWCLLLLLGCSFDYPLPANVHCNTNEDCGSVAGRCAYDPGRRARFCCIDQTCLLDASVPADSADTEAGVEPDSQGELIGPPLGKGTTPNVQLRKPLKVMVTAPSAKFEVGEANALRMAGIFGWTVRVTSLSDEIDCNVAATRLEIRDSGGVVVLMETNYSVTGSVADGGFILPASSCLRPGESGYLLGLELDYGDSLFRGADSIELAVARSSIGTLPRARLVPESYEPSGIAFKVMVRNVGTESATIGGANFPKYLLLDEEGRPLHWGFLQAPAPADPIEPGATVVLAPQHLSFEGRSTRMRVFVDFF